MTLENSPGGSFAVPLNIRCSRKCGRPDLPGGLSAEPTLYHTQWVTTGARRLVTTTTSMPLASVNASGANTCAGVRPPGSRESVAVIVLHPWPVPAHSISLVDRCAGGALRLDDA